MKKMRLYLALILALSLVLPLRPFSVIEIVTAQNDCRSLIKFDSDLIAQLDPLQQWHEHGLCGQGIKIGIIATSFPEREAINDLLDVGRIEIHPQQNNIWSQETSTLRSTHLIKTLHAIAPEAKIYFFRLDNSQDFIVASDWMLANEVRIIANLVAHPAFSETELIELTEFMDKASERNILWLNAAGNFGNSYYESQLDWSKWQREGWHYFSDSAHGLLPIQVVDNTQNVRAYILWEDKNAELELSVFQDAEDLIPLDTSGSSYISDPNQAVGRLDIGFLSDSQIVYLALLDTNYFRSNIGNGNFRIFLVNATIQDVHSSGNSIPAPNANPHTLTIGAVESGQSPLLTSSAIANGKPEILTFGSSLEENTVEYGTSFSTLIVAGVAAVYWSQDTTQSAAVIRDRLIPHNNEHVLAVDRLGDDSKTPWFEMGIATLIGILILAVVAAVLWLKDRQLAIQQLRESDFRAELSSDCQVLTILFELPLRRNGYPYLLRYFKMLRVDLAFDPRLNRKPDFDSWLANINIERKKSNTTEAARGGLKIGNQSEITSQDPLLRCTHLSEREAVVAVDLRFQFYIRLPIELSFTSLEWHGIPDCPERVQAQLKISSHNDFILHSTALIADRISAKGVSDRPHITLYDAQLSSRIGSDDDESSQTITQRVFVSYSSKDRPFVQDLLVSLRQRATTCEFWIDVEQITDGVPFWDQEIQNGLDSSNKMLLIISPDSMSSPEVGREWNYFLQEKKPVLVVVYRKPEKIHYRLRPSQMIFYDEKDTAAIYQRIVSSLSC
ncbi:TIR domain-containing protein [Aggregatilinea lenta]|uniref:TIR domain-containing protein n=1 Tax=Aggregatilinea lenta TaxID=913108 RepID=UPI000E5B9011|nr:TIR domain-containing protein [Aggregatilinea lenta]